MYYNSSFATPQWRSEGVGAGGSATLHHNYVYFNDGLIKFVDRIDPLGNPISSNNSHNSVNYAVQTFLQRNPIMHVL